MRQVCGVEVSLQRGRRPTDGALGEAASEHLGVEALDVAVGQAADVGAGDQGAELGRGLRQPGGELDPEGRGRRPHFRGAQGQGARLALERVGAVAVPPATRRGAPLVVAATQEGLDLFLQPDLKQELGRPRDKLAQGGPPGSRLGDSA